jgi:uncharacterized protein (TIGR02453 family)
MAQTSRAPLAAADALARLPIREAGANASAMTDAAFPGFPGAQAFLAGLAQHNDRDWFNANKRAYEQTIKGPAEAFVACLEPQLAAIAGGPVSGRIFRIHRDVRFAKDKRPYNAHLHIAFGPGATRAGREETPRGYFFGLYPDRAVLGAGGFHFQGPMLDAYRAGAADASKGPRLEAILRQTAKAGYRVEGEQLKRVPAPYAADHPRGELIRRKSLNAWRDIDDPATVSGAGLTPQALEVFAALTPLVSWLASL